ncbi:MAG: ABC transporter ATP-binding protein [Hyphomicrobiaceae bacterium]
MKPAPLFRVDDLKITFEGDGGRLTPAVTGVTFEIGRGETVGIVGESGCGKSVTALATLRLLPHETSRISGNIEFEGRNLPDLTERQMQELRGNRIAMIFQEPMTSLNPSYTVGDQIGEALERHRGMSAKAARAEAVQLLQRVRIPSPETRVDAYPHKLSGGMRQRVMIAMALACEPALLIADEPTTALDVTIQAQVLDLLRDLSKATGTAVLLITHDLGVVAEMCNRVVVMYAGEVVEQALVEDLFAQPQHPYTVGLLGSIPRSGDHRARLSSISGSVPALSQHIPGCRFAARCPFADDHCRAKAPPLIDTGGGHLSRCWKTPLEALVA